MHKLNPRTAALLSAFGWAVGYLLAGKVLAVLLPVPPYLLHENMLKYDLQK